jgi:1-acyl-sn-glycerol-3-phosphate acyltransferase
VAEVSTPGRGTSRRPPSLASVNHEPRERTMAAVVTVINAVLAPLTLRDWRDQHKIPQTGGLVIVANHISNVDPLALGQYLAYSGRWPRYLAKSSLFEVPVLGRVLQAAGQIPVERGTRSASQALVHAIEAVQAGQAVIIYPEGTITTDPDLWPMAGKTGAARVALATGCPIVPIGQWGAQEIMYGKEIGFPKLWPRKTLRFKAGAPVPLDDLRDDPVTAPKLVRATERIMGALTALVAELRGEPAPTPPGVAERRPRP